MKDQTMKDRTIRTLAMAGILAAATILLTTLVSIPMPGGLGFLNLGDAGVLTGAFLLGWPWGALCGAVASALSDVLLGYAVYAPATLLIKGGMAALAALLLKIFPKKLRALAFLLAALLVPAGYFLYESILYGAAAAGLNVAFNLVQCLVGAGVACALAAVLEKAGIADARRN